MAAKPPPEKGHTLAYGWEFQFSMKHLIHNPVSSLPQVGVLLEGWDGPLLWRGGTTVCLLDTSGAASPQQACEWKCSGSLHIYHKHQVLLTGKTAF